MAKLRNYLLLAMLALAVGAPAEARADCASPRAFFASPAGATLPTTGETYLFTPDYSWQKPPLSYKVTATVDGKDVAITFAAASTAPGYRAWRVSWADLSPGKLRLTAVDNHGGAVAKRQLTVSRAWKKPEAFGPLVKRPSQTHSSWWACSHDHQRVQTLEHAAAVYRVTFHAAKVGAKPRVQYFPTNINQFFGGPGDKGSLGLGHVSCFGHTYTWNGDVTVDVEALLPDGSTLSRSSGLRLSPPKADPTAPAWTSE